MVTILTEDVLSLEIRFMPKIPLVEMEKESKETAIIFVLSHQIILSVMKIVCHLLQKMHDSLMASLVFW